jgi:hypothetical protein
VFGLNIRSSISGIVLLALLGCTGDEMDNAISAEAPFKILGTEHNFGLDGYSDRLLFLSSHQFGFVCGQVVEGNKFTTLALSDNGSLIQKRALTDSYLFPGDSTVNDFIVDLPPNGSLSLTSIAGYLPYGAARIGADVGLSVNVVIRFGPARKQKAHRFIAPPGSYYSTPREQYIFKDFVEVPFEVWDVDNERQLAVSFRDQADNGRFDLRKFNHFSPADETASFEFLFIHEQPYHAETPDDQLVYQGLDARSAIWILPTLGDSYPGREWDPVTVGYNEIEIRRTTQPFVCSILDIDAAFFREESDEYWLVSRGYTNNNYRQVMNISVLDRQMKVIRTEAVVLDGLFWASRIRAWQTSDNGLIATASYFADDIATTIVKVNEANTIEHVTHSPKNVSHVFEHTGKYYFTADFDIFEFNALGKNQVATTDVSFQNFARVTAWKDYFIGVSLGNQEPELHQFDRQFTFLGSEALRKVGRLDWIDGTAMELISVGSELFFSAPAIGQGVGESDSSPLFLVGKVPSNLLSSSTPARPNNLCDLAFSISQSRSCFNEDGSAAHLVVLNRSQRSTDVLFFKTNEDFALKR